MHNEHRGIHAADRLSGRPGLLKALNTMAVVERLAEVGGASRVALAAAVGLSATSVSRITDALIRAGLVREGDRIASRVGRRQTLLELEPSAGSVLALDIRTNSVRFALSDLRGGRVAHQRVPMTATDLRGLVDQVGRHVDEFASAVGGSLLTVVVGLPGAWDAVQRRVYAVPNLAFAEGVDLEAAFEQRLGVDVVIDNDINFAALGEYHECTGDGVDDLFYLNLGSGVGGGLVVGGRLHRGHAGFAGEVGSLPVFDARSGTLVTLESLIGRAALDARLLEQGWADGIVGLLAQDRVEQHAEVVAFLAQQCAVAIAATASLADPGLVVLGGSIGRYGEVLIPLVDRALETLTSHAPPIVLTRLGEDAALRGATAVGLARARTALVERITSEPVG